MERLKSAVPIERFEDPVFQNRYWIPNPRIASKLLRQYREEGTPYGLEFGFGLKPTRVHKFDDSVDWFMAEVSSGAFAQSQGSFPAFWEDAKLEGYSSEHTMYAVRVRVTREMIENAKVVLFRSFDYANPEVRALFPRLQDLKSDQRIILLAHEMSHNEARMLELLLAEKGFSPFDLVPAGALQFPVVLSERGKTQHIFDFTKK